MRISEYCYNLLIHAGLPALVAGTYYALIDRNADVQTARKFSLPSGEYMRDDYRLWLHGASVGEASLLNQLTGLATSLGVHEDAIIVSTQTESGLEAVSHPRKFLLPADYPALIGPLSRTIDPDCLAVVETEIWPNLYRCNSGNVLLLNGRISDSTLEYYRWLKPLMDVTLSHTKGIFTRSEEDMSRFLELGAPRDRTSNVGDLKWLPALEPPDEDVRTPWSETDRVVTFGSTHPGEERLLLKSIRGEDVRINLAPRHLSRLGEVENVLDQIGLDWEYWSNEPEGGDSAPKVLLVDEFGLLEGLYRQSDLAVVGGSWRTSGGHNVLEAAQYGTPVITGPNTENFRETVDLLRELELLKVVSESNLPEVMKHPGNYFDENNDSNRAKLQNRIRPIRDRYREILKDTLESADGREHANGT